MKGLFIILALAASAFALQYPVEYRYLYEGRLATGIPGLRAQVSAVGIKAEVVLQMKSKSQALVKLSNVQVADFNDDLQCVHLRQPIQLNWSPIPQYKEIIEQPFGVNFLEERDDHVLSVPQADLEFITNIRKSVVGVLRAEPVLANLKDMGKVISGGKAPEAFSLEEETIFGRCETQYSVIRLPEYLAKAEKEEIMKYLKEDDQRKDSARSTGASIPKLEEDYYRLIRSVNFDKCHDRVILQHSGAANMSRAGYAQFESIQSRSSVGTYILKGRPGAFRVERAIIEGDVIANPFGFKTKRMQTITNQTLVIEAAKAIGTSLRLPNLIRAVKTWRYAVASPFSAPEGHPKLWVNYYNKGDKYFPVAPETTYLGIFPKSPFNQENKKNIIAMIESIVREVYSAPSEPSRIPSFKSTKSSLAATQLYLVTKMMRVIPLDTVKQIFSEIFSQKDFMGQKKQILLVDIAAASGASAPIKVLIEMMKSQQISHQRIGSVLMTIPNNLLAPSVIPDLMEYVKSIDMERNPILASTALVNFASLAERVCINHKKFNYSVPNPVFGKESCSPSQILSSFLPYLKQKAEGASQSWERAIAVQAITKLGSPHILPVLMPFAYGKVDSDPLVRSVAIYGFSKKRIPDSAREVVFDTLMTIIDNIGEQSEIRQAAFSTLLSWQPDAAWWQRMARMTWREPSQSMAAYIAFTAKSLAKSTEPHLQRQSSIAAFVLPLLKPFSPSQIYSYNYLFSRFDQVSKDGANADVAFIESIQEIVPREIYSALRENYGDLSFDLYEAAISSEGLSHIVSGFLSSLQSTSSVGGWVAPPSSVRDYNSRYIDNVMTQMKQQFGRQDSNSEAQANIYLRMFDNMYQYIPLNPEVISKIAGQGASDFLNKLLNGHSVNMTKYANPIDIEYFLPTEIGLPLVGSISMPTMQVADIHLKLVTSSGSRPTLKSLLKATNVTVLMKSNYKYLSKLIVKMQVPAPWSKKWIESGVENMKEVNLPVYGNLTVHHTDEVKNVTLNLAPFTDKKFAVAHAHNIPFTQIRDVVSTPECSSNYKVIAIEKSRTPALKIHKEFEKAYTGLSVELNYDADAPYPYTTALFLEYARRPERLGQLLISPTAKQWQYSWILNPSSSTRNVSISLSYFNMSASSNSPRSESIPDFSAEDSESARINKVRSLSEGSKVYGINAQVFFNGTEFRKYETLLAFTRKSQSQSKTNMKAVIAFMASPIPGINNTAQALCSQADLSTPAIDDFSSLQQAVQSSELKETASGQVYYGISCRSPSISSYSGWSKVSNERLSLIQEEFKKLCSFDQADPAVELQTPAVYDQAHLEVDFSMDKMPKSLVNLTYIVQDTIEGYMYPHGSYNNMHRGQDNKIVVDAKRPLSSERYSFWAELPQKHSIIREIRVPYALTRIVPWVGLKTSFSSSPSLMIAPVHISTCTILKDSISTYDHVSFPYAPIHCWTTATYNYKNPDDFVVHTRLNSTGAYEAQVLMPSNNVNVIASKNVATINGETMEPTETTRVIKNKSGQVIMKVTRHSTKRYEIEVVGKLKVVVKHYVTIIPLIYSNNMLRGVCGDYDNKSKYDKTGPKGCLYTDNELFKWSWTIGEGDGCDQNQFSQKNREVQDFQKTCQKRPPTWNTVQEMRSVYAKKDRSFIYVYPIKKTSSEICASMDCVQLCAKGYTAQEKTNVKVRSKCWDLSLIPLDVANAEKIGYLTYQTSAPAMYNKEIEVEKDTLCKK